MLNVIQWANDRAQKKAMELIKTDNIAERIEVFKECGAIYTMDNMDRVVSDVDCITELLFRCYLKENEWATKEDFLELFGQLDVPMMQVFVDKLSGFDEIDKLQSKNGPGQVEDKESAGTQPLPPSAKNT